MAKTLSETTVLKTTKSNDIQDSRVELDYHLGERYQGLAKIPISPSQAPDIGLHLSHAISYYKQAYNIAVELQKEDSLSDSDRAIAAQAAQNIAELTIDNNDKAEWKKRSYEMGTKINSEQLVNSFTFSSRTQKQLAAGSLVASLLGEVVAIITTYGPRITKASMNKAIGTPAEIAQWNISRGEFVMMGAAALVIIFAIMLWKANKQHSKELEEEARIYLEQLSIR